jgi:hypothetical protein
MQKEGHPGLENNGVVFQYLDVTCLVNVAKNPAVSL